MTATAHEHAYAIFDAAIPVIRIHSIGGKPWKRNVAKRLGLVEADGCNPQAQQIVLRNRAAVMKYLPTAGG